MASFCSVTILGAGISIPARRKVREGRGARFVADAKRDQKPGPLASQTTPRLKSSLTEFLPG